LAEIVEIQLARLRERLGQRRIAIELDDAAMQHIVSVGYEPAYGARPIKRTIQRELETPLSRKILAGDIHDGDSVRVGYDVPSERLTFDVERAATPV